MKNTYLIPDIFELPNSALSEGLVRVRLFGSLQVENCWDNLSENPGEKPLVFLLLKYFLLEPERFSDIRTVAGAVRPEEPYSENLRGALRLQMKRLRDMLKPLHLDGENGLLRFGKRQYGVNPEHELVCDTDVFVALFEQVKRCDRAEPHGLKLAMKALALYRGKLMDQTDGVSWLSEKRDYYHDIFCSLMLDTLYRMETLGNEEGLALLCSRALSLVSGEDPLHKEIVRFLVRKKNSALLKQYIFLLHKAGKAHSLMKEYEPEIKAGAEEDEETRTSVAADDDRVYMHLFGELEVMRNGRAARERYVTEIDGLSLLKYLVLEPGKKITQEELLQDFPATRPATFGLRLSKARKMLTPLGLESTKGLLLYKRGVYQCNSDYPVVRDVDIFNSLLVRIGKLPVNEPEGLMLCVSALEVCRGNLLSQTENASWLAPYQAQYQTRFLTLARETLNRMRALDKCEIAPLLCQRAAMIVPEDRNICQEIVEYLKAQEQDDVQKEYWRLLCRFGNAALVKDCFPSQITAGNERTVFVQMLGGLVIENKEGRLEESIAKQSFPLRLFKYLLAEINHTPDLNELSKYIWPDSDQGTDKKALAGMRLMQARQKLAPLGLEQTDGLVLHENGVYCINPDLTLQRDLDLFQAKIQRVQAWPENRQERLITCVSALLMYRGVFLEGSEEMHWVEERRPLWHGMFCTLCKEMLKSINALGRKELLPLLFSRVMLFAPEEKGLQDEIRAQLEKSGLEQFLKLCGNGTQNRAAEVDMPKQSAQADGAGDERIVYVKLFGDVEIRNRYGRVKEALKRQTLPVQLLKYMLVNEKEEISRQEIVSALSGEEDGGPNSLVNMWLLRAREFLAPLRIGTAKGLLLFKKEICRLNPDYTVLRDVDRFAQRMEQIKACPENAHEGLEYCADALELYHGPLMADTDALWLLQEREMYQKAFCFLAEETLRRVKILGDESCLPLLSKRTSAFLPDNQMFHEELIEYLEVHGHDELLVQHIFGLARTDNAVWLDEA